MTVKIEKYGAQWCMPCKVLDRTLENIKGVEIRYFDADKDPEAFEREGIRNVPVLIYRDDEGNELLRQHGAVSEQQIRQALEAYNG